jgi:hypothetical protein
MSLLVKNREVIRYISEIKIIEKKFKNRELRKSEVILNALESYYKNLIKEIVEREGKQAIENYISDKELLKKNIIIL